MCRRNSPTSADACMNSIAPHHSWNPALSLSPVKRLGAPESFDRTLSLCKCICRCGVVCRKNKRRGAAAVLRALSQAPALGTELGRLGGEELLLLLPGIGIEGRVAVERVRTTLEPHANVRFTFSAGLAQGRPGEPLSEVVERADRALYRAKGLGRNRTVNSLS